MQRPSSKTDIPPLTGAVCVLCVVIFVMLMGAKDWAIASRWGYYPEDALYEGKWWALITHAFVHREPLHLLFNMAWLWTLGGAMERSVGMLRWLLFLLCAALVSSGIATLGEGWGIGMSGVIYGLCGFGWMVRRRYPEFTRVVTYDTLKLFVGWGVLCVFLTYTKILNVGNLAHLSGFVFGIAVGAMVDWPKWRIPAALGIVVMFGLALTTIYWSPRSAAWTGKQAVKAQKADEWDKAIRGYRRYIDLGGDAEWAWTNLAEIYGYRRDAKNYREAMQELGRLSPYEAAKVRSKYGTPNR